VKQLVAAGVSLRQLLAAATIDNAEAFNLADRYGTVEEGKVANLLLLDENPLDSVDAWRVSMPLSCTESRSIGHRCLRTVGDRLVTMGPG
jgi:imidazolonepropionase-like amidohydrolase